MTLKRRIIDFLGLRRNIVTLLVMVVLVGMGEKLGERFLPIYLIALGGSSYAIGLLNGMDNLLSALYSFPGGYLSDRVGYKRALAIFNLVAMAGYVIVILFPTWQAVIVGSRLLHLMGCALAARDHEPGCCGAAQGKAHYGRVAALPGAAHPHGARSGDRWTADRRLR